MPRRRLRIRTLAFCALAAAPLRADVAIPFDNAASELDDNFVLASAANTAYSATGGAGDSGGMVSCSGAPSYFLYDPGSGARSTSTDTTANGVQTGDFTVGFDFRAGSANDSFGVWFYDGASEGSARPSGNARLVLLNVNASGASERVRWWTGGTAHTNSIGTAQRDANPADTTVTTGAWYHAELGLVKTGTDLVATFTVWNQTKTTQYFSDTTTFTGVSQSGGQVAFRVNAVSSSTPAALDNISLGAPSSGPGDGPAAGPGNPGGSIGGTPPAAPSAPPLRDVERLFPAGTVIDPTQSPYFADKTGATDATAALQAALNAASGRIVWLPDGTYRVSDTLRFITTTDVNCRLIGQSRAGVVIKLADSAAGFTDSAAPRPVLVTGLADSGNVAPNAFGRFVENLTIDTGAGNPGAIALHFYANNYGAARDLVLRSGDGQGRAGLDLGRTRNNGPLLVQRVRIEGFDYGVASGAEYGLGATLEHLSLANQRFAGIHNQNQQLSLRNIHTSGQLGPSLWNTVGHVTLVDAHFVAAPGGAAQPAVKNEAAGQLLLRTVVSSGYARCVDDPTHPVAAAYVNEWLSNASVSLFPTQGRTLGLPVLDAPEVPYDPPSAWVDLTAPPYNCKDSNLNNNHDNAAAIQAAIDSGATTLAVPAGVFLKVKSPVYLRGNVRRLIGLGGNAAIVGDGSMADNGTHPAIILADGAAPAVEWDGLHSGYGRALQFGSTSSRTLVIRDSATQGGRFSGSGDIFFDGVCGNPFTGFTFNGGGRVFARQLNPECDTTKLTVANGTRLWLLGLKTEKPKTILDLSGADSRAEILGAFLFAIDGAASDTMWKIADARASLNFFEYLYAAPYGTLVQETQAGVARTLARGAGVAIANGDNTPSTNDGTDFGAAQTGFSSVDRSFVVQNNGATALTFTATPRVALSGPQAADFAVVADLPATLAAGASATFTLRFTPQASGARAATVTLAHGDTGSPFVFALRGTGSTPAPIAAFSPSTLRLAVAVGRSATANFSIANQGYGPLTGTFSRNTGTTYFAARSSEPGGPAKNEWRTITNPVRLGVLAGYDDYASATFSLPFTFRFYGSNYSLARLTTNGALYLETSTKTANSVSNWTNGAIPTSVGTSGPQLFPYWDDLYFRTGASGLADASATHGRAEGDPDTFVVSCENISFYASSLSTRRFSFQTLLGADGSVRFNYLTLASNNSYSVGIQQSSANGVQIIADATGAPLASGDSILFTPPSSWVGALSPASGASVNIPARSALTGSLTADGAGLSAGRIYRGLLRLSGTNDPDRPLVWLPVELLATTTPLEAWRYNHLGDTASVGLAADTADPDHDGLPNLLEYALGTDPASASSGAAPTASLLSSPGSTLALSFTPATLEGLAYFVEASSDLVAWQAVEVTSSLAVGQPFTYADPVALDASAPRRFLRLRVAPR